jgi:hypothetical protein
VEFCVRALQVRYRDVKIPMREIKTAVAHEGLDEPNVHALVEARCRKRVPESVNRQRCAAFTWEDGFSVTTPSRSARGKGRSYAEIYRVPHR